MSHTSKGPRLYKRAARRKNGAVVRQPVWVVLDESKEVSTRIAAAPDQSKAPAEAVKFLSDYLIKQVRPERKAREIDDFQIADVLSIYLDDHVDPDKAEGELTAQGRHLVQTIGRLNNILGQQSPD